MCNVPPKFYKICRLCLSICNDSDFIKLSIFNNNNLNNDKNCIGVSDGGGGRGGGGYASKMISSSKSKASHNKSYNMDSDDDNDDEDGDDDSVFLQKRIAKCLAIKVRIFFFFLNFYDMSEKQ
jgi:hypothetical protein